jgi:hypothetical protein
MVVFIFTGPCLGILINYDATGWVRYRASSFDILNIDGYGVEKLP